LPAAVAAEVAQLPLPRYASLEPEVNLRAGPGKDYLILRVYQRKGLLSKSSRSPRIDISRPDGTLGWVQQNLLSGRRMVKIVGETRTLLAKPEPAAKPVARLEAGVIARLRECRAGPWCRIEIEGRSGWIARDWIWGVQEGEILEAD
jgi:SH3-like domain-containing protein